MAWYTATLNYTDQTILYLESFDYDPFDQPNTKGHLNAVFHVKARYSAAQDLAASGKRAGGYFGTTPPAAPPYMAPDTTYGTFRLVVKDAQGNVLYDETRSDERDYRIRGKILREYAESINGTLTGYYHKAMNFVDAIIK
jgi:hypothetical protein